MTLRTHTHKRHRTVGVLQVMDESVHKSNYPRKAADMIESFYPAAYIRTRAAERLLGVPHGQQLKIQYMGDAWGSGDPTSSLPANVSGLLFDDHRYYKWDDNIRQTKAGCLATACLDERGGSDIIVGECSLGISNKYQDSAEFAIGSNAVDTEEQRQWYRTFWAAQAQAFERSGGWIFWTWKCNWISG